MTPTAFNNAIVSVVSAYAEVLQQLAAENELLRKAAKQAIPPDMMLVTKKKYGKLRDMVTTISKRGANRKQDASVYLAELEVLYEQAMALVHETENP
jgi:hypothetical protein